MMMPTPKKRKWTEKRRLEILNSAYPVPGMSPWNFAWAFIGGLVWAAFIIGWLWWR